MAAGKTGTTQGSADGWYIGINRNLVTATWVGADDPVVMFRNCSYGQGAHMALPIYAYFMRNLIDGNQDFKLNLEMIDKPTGNGGIMTDCGVEVPSEDDYLINPDKNEDLEIDDLG